MSQAHIEQFYQASFKDPAIVADMLKSSIHGEEFEPEDFVRAAVAKGKELGYDFSYDEADAWIKKIQQIRANGELDDAQLGAVAGGWGKWNATNQAADYTRGGGNIGEKIGHAILGGGWTAMMAPGEAVWNVASSLGSKSTWNKVGDFFSSW